MLLSIIVKFDKIIILVHNGTHYPLSKFKLRQIYSERTLQIAEINVCSVNICKNEFSKIKQSFATVNL